MDSVVVRGGQSTIQVEGQIALADFCPDVIAGAERKGNVVRLNIQVRDVARSSTRRCDDAHTVTGVWYSATLDGLPKGSYTVRVQHSASASEPVAGSSSRALPPAVVKVR